MGVERPPWYESSAAIPTHSWKRRTWPHIHPEVPWAGIFVPAPSCLSGPVPSCCCSRSGAPVSGHWWLGSSSRSTSDFSRAWRLACSPGSASQAGLPWCRGLCGTVWAGETHRVYRARSLAPVGGSTGGFFLALVVNWNLSSIRKQFPRRPRCLPRFGGWGTCFGSIRTGICLRPTRSKTTAGT